MIASTHAVHCVENGKRNTMGSKKEGVVFADTRFKNFEREYE